MNLRKGCTISKWIFIMAFVNLPWFLTAQVISEKGHPEHFVGGIAIGAVTTHLVWDKVKHPVKAWTYGIMITSATAGLKEWVDPKWFGGTRSSKDFLYTLLGGIVGATVVVSLSTKRKNRSNVQLKF